MGMKYYDEETNEKFVDAKIIGGKPSGVINQVKEPFKWARTIYKLMQSYTWYVSECNVSQDKIPYKILPEEHKYAYDMALGQLIVNDSIQTKQLVDGISRYITSPSVNICLVRQAYEEAEHSVTYTTIAEEVCDDVDRIYELHKHEPMLARKNRAVTEMYDNVTQENKIPTGQELIIAFTANQILEQQVFPGGFVVLWSFNFTGTNKAIQFIERDESGTHVPLFKNIFRAAVKQEGLLPDTLIKIKAMIKHMNDEEIIWTKHISKNLLGFSDNSIKMFVEYHSNSVCKNLNIDLLYDVTDGGPLMSLFKQQSLLYGKTKTNFFETASGDYAVNSLDEDY